MPLPACLAVVDSLLSTQPDSLALWKGARLGNATDIAALSTRLGLERPQLAALLASFLPSFQSAYVNNAMCNAFGLPAIEFLAYEQWARLTITSGVPLSTLFPQHPLFAGIDVPFEFPLAASISPGENWMTGARAAMLLNGTLRGGPDAGLLSTNGLVDFLTDAVPPHAGVLGAKYNLDGHQVVDMFVYGLRTLESYGKAYAAELVNDNAGMFITKTVDQWLFDCHDALLAVVQPNGTCALITNTTSLEWAATNTPPDTITTGYGDLSATLQYTKYQTQATVAWNNYNAPVFGSDGTQFPPLLFNSFDRSALVHVFETDLVRSLPLAFDRHVSAHGIALNRYLPLRELFLPDERFFQYVTGFANLTITQQAPIFFSYPNMLFVDPKYVAKIDGMHPRLDDQASIDVEPITGLTMRAHKRIQVNVYIPPDLAFDDFNPDVVKDIFYPIVWVDETSEITPALAADFRSSVYLLRDLRLGSVIVLSVAAAAALAASLICWFKAPAGSPLLPPQPYSPLDKPVAPTTSLPSLNEGSRLLPPPPPPLTTT